MNIFIMFFICLYVYNVASGKHNKKKRGEIKPERLLFT